MRHATRWISLTVVALTLASASPLTAAGEQGRRRNPAEGKAERARENGQRAGENRRQGQMRFRGMDRDGDGRITRVEWQGNDTAFASHDWDGNGVLEGDEVRPGAPRPSALRNRDDDLDRDRDRPRDRNREDKEAADNRQRNQRETWRRWDRNGDGVLTRAEWRGRTETFTRLDRNQDGILTASEIRDWR